MFKFKPIFMDIFSLKYDYLFSRILLKCAKMVYYCKDNKLWPDWHENSFF